MIEQDTRYIIDSNLNNKGWILDINNPQKNVFFESDILRVFDNQKLKKLKIRPDYVLFDNENKKPIGVIEAKAGGKNLDNALDQAMEYADILQAPLIFAMNNSYCQTRHLSNGKPLFINENEVNELIRQKEALKFLQENTNEIYTIPKKVIVSRQELIKIFQNLNDVLRDEGLSAGIERLNEFANVLFLKLYCEKKGDNIWNTLKTVDNSLLIDTFNNSLKVIEKKYNASVFTDLQLQKPDTLKDIIGRLDKLIFSSIDMDIIGGAFEYFLQQATATSNDLGEYFTPRHIVKTIVNLVNPQFKETIYDPFCGTGGFLTESFNYIKENTIIDSKEEEQLKEKTIFGREITKNARLGKMNMILHGDGHSGVEQINSLENPVDSKYDVVITNMPFSQKITREIWNEEKKKYEKKNNITHLYYNSLAKNSGDGVCILHCFKAVKKGGRMALVVPEGVLFRRELKEVRKHLLDNAKLETVVSLPQGAFLPYTGVKTSILYFTNCHSGKTQDKIWYFDVKNDGFSLDNHRRQIKENDLKRVDYVDFKRKNQDENILDIGFEAIDLEKIKENDYNFVGSVYIQNIADNHCNIVKLKDVILEIKDGGTPPRKSKDSNKYFNGNTNWCVVKDIQTEIYETNEKLTDIGLQNCSAKVWDIDSIIISLGATIGNVGIAKKPTATKQGLSGIVVDKAKILPKYLYYMLTSRKTEIQNMATGATIKEVRPSRLIEQFYFPLPSLEEQQKIVNELDSYQKVIEGARQIVENWKPDFEIDDGWEVVKIESVAKIQGGFAFKSKDMMEKGDVQIIKIGNIRDLQFYSKNTPSFIDKQYYEKYKQYQIHIGDILISMTGTAGKRDYGNVCKVDIKDNLLLNQRVGRFIIKSDILPDYLLYTFLRNEIKDQLYTNATGGIRQGNISAKQIENITIPLPPLSIQQQIVEQIENERKIVEMNKQLIALQEEKIKNKIASLWQQDKQEKSPLPNSFDLLLEKACQPVQSKK